MLYHVIRRPLNPNTTNSSNQQRSESVSPPKLMPRYHYSRIVENNNPDSNLTPNSLDDNSSKSIMTATTTTTSNNNNTNNSYGPFKSSFIPLVTNKRPTLNKREFTQIPISREDGTTSSTTNHTRSVPITYIETTTLPVTNNGNLNSRQNFTSKFFRKKKNSKI
jgi:hypothetical protein